MPKNYNVNEGSGKTVHSELKSNSKINEGDTITYQANNQMGYEKYKVVLNEKGKKALKLIDNYDMQMDSLSETATPSPRSRSSSRTSSKKGGKTRKTLKRRKTNRRKN